MKTFIIVYSPTRFTVGGSIPVKRFEAGGRCTFTDAPTAIEGGGSDLLDRGIYGIVSDAKNVRPEIYPEDPAKEGTDYDLVTVDDKDPWPKVVAEQVQRASTAFPTVSDAELTQFLYSLGR